MPASAAASTASVAPCPSRSTTTRRFALVLVWILVSAFSYGFGISELNPLQPILTCHTRHPAPVLLSPTATRCIPLTESQFGLVTSLFTLGGLVSSFSISPLAKSLAWGRRASISLSSLFGLVGSLVLTFARSVVPLALGRFVQGLGSGIGVVVVPMYINEISPTSLQGSNGVLNQLSIVIGIFTAQVLGASRLGDGGESWRWIPATAAILSALQLAAGFLIGVESPGWLQGEGRKAGSEEQAYRARRLLWSADEVERHRQDAGRPAAGDGAAGTEETQRLLADGSTQDGSDDADDADDGREHSVGLVQILTDPEIRPGALMVVFTQLGQQLSGVVRRVLALGSPLLALFAPPSPSPFSEPFSPPQSPPLLIRRTRCSTTAQASSRRSSLRWRARSGSASPSSTCS
ncbi:Bifunctional purine biosynthesis protein PurH [Thecaphora frezii]